MTTGEALFVFWLVSIAGFFGGWMLRGWIEDLHRGDKERECTMDIEYLAREIVGELRKRGIKAYEYYIVEWLSKYDIEFLEQDVSVLADLYMAEM